MLFALDDMRFIRFPNDGRSSYRLLRPHRNSCFYALLLVDRWSRVWQYPSRDFLKLFIWKCCRLLYANNKIKINELSEYLKIIQRARLPMVIKIDIISVNSDIDGAARNWSLYLLVTIDSCSIFQFTKNWTYRNYNDFNPWLSVTCHFHWCTYPIILC